MIHTFLRLKTIGTPLLSLISVLFMISCLGEKGKEKRLQEFGLELIEQESTEISIKTAALLVEMNNMLVDKGSRPLDLAIMEAAVETFYASEKIQEELINYQGSNYRDYAATQFAQLFSPIESKGIEYDQLKETFQYQAYINEEMLQHDVVKCTYEITRLFAQQYSASHFFEQPELAVIKTEDRISLLLSLGFQHRLLVEKIELSESLRNSVDLSLFQPWTIIEFKDSPDIMAKLVYYDHHGLKQLKEFEAMSTIEIIR